MTDYSKSAKTLREIRSNHSIQREEYFDAITLCERVAAGELVEPNASQSAGWFEARRLASENERLRARVAELEATVAEIDRGITMFPHDAEMALRDRYYVTAESVLSEQRRMQHVATTPNKRVQWNEPTLDALAHALTEAHIRGAKEATK